MKKTNFPSVGISEIGIAIPSYFISLEELAKKRKVKLEYVTKGLGVFQARIPYQTSLEELASQAILKIHYQDVKRFYIATESDPDASKPLGIKILNKKLKLTTIPFQYKFACLGGLEALISACEYSLSNQGSPAIVLTIDRSFYKKEEPEAEMTQGCAAVALRIEINPKILILDYQNFGQYGADIDDFYTPPFSFPFPIINGELTKVSYLLCQKNALLDWENKNRLLVKKLEKEKKSLVELCDFIVMHTPFPKMVEWASAVFWRHEKEMQKEHLSLSQCLKNPSLFKEYKKEIDRIRKKPQFQEFFEKKVKPSLKYSPYIGNAYTSSLFIALISVLEQSKRNQEIGMSGYGSGASALCLRSKTVGGGFKSDLAEQLKQGKKLNLNQYERWRKSIENENLSHSQFF